MERKTHITQSEGAKARQGQARLQSAWRTAALATLAATLALTTGCEWFRSITGQDDDYVNRPIRPTVTTQPVTTEQRSERTMTLPPALQPNNRPIVQGPLPLIYLVESDCDLRVSNLTTGEEIITFPAKSMQIVRVESRGVMLANEPVIGAQLAAGTYAISLVSPTGDEVRATQSRTQTVIPPTTGPATTPPAPAPTAPPSPVESPAPPAPQ